MQVTEEPGSDESTGLRLSRAQYWGSWAFAVACFLFGTGPIWEHPWALDKFDRAALWSYLPIPILVAGCLLWSKRLGLRAFLLNTLELTLLKYAATFMFALVLWEVTPPPAPGAAPPPPHRAVEQEAPPPPTPIAAGSTGTIEVVVVDAAGLPAPSALVYVAAGLEGYVFAPPAEPLVLTNDGRGVSPRLAVAMVGQTIEGRSADAHLHTLIAVSRGATLFNIPLISSGEPSRVRARDVTGMATIRCNVHRGGDEAEGRVLVLSHPFFAKSGEDGRVRLAGVPGGALRVAALHEERGAAEEPVALSAGGSSEIRLSLRR